MMDYTLTVFETGRSLPIETVTVRLAADVMTAIPKLLADHPGCERIRVQAGATYLFSIDCTGATIPE